MRSKIPERLSRLLEKAREPFRASCESIPVWRESGDVWALADSERHLGHAIRADQQWIAYDAIHVNPSSDGFRLIGTFQTAEAAKQAIENVVRLSWAWGVGGATLEQEVKIDSFPRKSSTN